MSAPLPQADPPSEEPTLTVAPPSVIPDGRSDSHPPDQTCGTTASPFERRHGDLPPPTLPGYEVLSELGRGGMGVVYRARQKGLNRQVALKVVLAGGHASASQRLRFIAEAEAVAALSHPGIVGVYEFGTWEGQPFIALEFCPNGTLADRLLGTPLPHAEAASLILRVAKAVAAAHARGIVHRDLKPANVLLSSDGSPKVTDFGLAKLMESGEGLTASGAVMGTPSYMAPEQAKGDAKSVGPPADVYALGAVLYECLTGRPPFKGASAAETILQTLHQEPVAVRALNPLVPVDLETVCLKCLEKEPARRYSNALTLAEDLERFLEGRPVVARPVGWFGRSRRWVRRNRAEAGLLTAVALAILAGTTATYIKYRAEAHHREEADRARAEAQGEAAAKEQALSELQTTLAALKTLTEQQQATLQKLTEEKAATEDNLLRGLLRPMREPPVSTITLQETRALLELAGLPDERQRFLFIERALGHPDRALKLASWPDEIVGAVVGLDRAAALRLRMLVSGALRAENTPPPTQIACAFLVIALPADSQTLNVRAARVLAERLVAETDANDMSFLADGLSDLARRLGPTEAAPLLKLVTERFVRERDAIALSSLGTALSALAARLPAAELAPLVRTLADRIVADTDVATLYTVTNTLTEQSDRLGPAGATLLALPTRVIADRLAIEKDLSIISNLTSPFTLLASRVDADAASVATRILVARVVVEKDSGSISYLSSSLSVLAEDLPAPEARVHLKAIAARLTTEQDANILSVLTNHAGIFASRLEPAEARELLAPFLRNTLRVLPTESDSNLLSTYSSCLSQLGTYITTADAREVARLIVTRLTTEKDQSKLSYLSGGLNALAAALPAADSVALAQIIAERLATEKDPYSANYLSGTLLTLASRHAPLGGFVARSHTRKLLDRILAEKGSQLGSQLASGLGTLGGYLRASDVNQIASALIDRIVAEKDPTALSNMQTAFGYIVGEISREQAASFAGQLTARMAGEKDHNLHYYFGYVLLQLFDRLPASECAALAGRVARPQINRLVSERDANTFSSLAGSVGLLISKIDAPEAAALIRPLMVRLTIEKDPTTQYHLTNLVSQFAGRLSAEDAAPFARAIAQRMLQERDTAASDRLAMILPPLVGRLNDADLWSLLKPYLVFPPVRTVVLAELGTRSNRHQTTGSMAVGGCPAACTVRSPGFTNIWDCVEWVENARPDLELRGSPPVMPGG